MITAIDLRKIHEKEFWEVCERTGEEYHGSEFYLGHSPVEVRVDDVEEFMWATPDGRLLTLDNRYTRMPRSAAARLKAIRKNS